MLMLLELVSFDVKQNTPNYLFLLKHTHARTHAHTTQPQFIYEDKWEFLCECESD